MSPCLPCLITGGNLSDKSNPSSSCRRGTHRTRDPRFSDVQCTTFTRGYPRTPMEAESCSEVSHGAGSVSVSFSPRPPMTCCFGKNHGFIASVRFKGGRSLNPTGQSNSGCPKTLGIGFDPSPSTLEASLSLSCCPGLKSICKWEMSIAKLYY